jgi:hypothetical protein
MALEFLKGRNNKDPFDKIFSRMATLRLKFPHNCEHFGALSCGVAQIPASEPLLKFFGERPSEDLKTLHLAVTVPADSAGDVGEAGFFATLNGRNAFFAIKSFNGSEDGLRIREVTLSRDGLPNNWKPVQRESLESEVLQIFINAAEKAAAADNLWLVCDSCPAKENGLPRPVVG